MMRSQSSEGQGRSFFLQPLKIYRLEISVLVNMEGNLSEFFANTEKLHKFFLSQGVELIYSFLKPIRCGKSEN